MPRRLKKLPPVHPGRAIRMVLDEIELSVSTVALALRIPPRRLTAIVNGKSPVSAEIAMRLGRYFGTSAQMWMNMQNHYDLELAERELADRIAAEVQPYQKTV